MTACCAVQEVRLPPLRSPAWAQMRGHQMADNFMLDFRVRSDCVYKRSWAAMRAIAQDRSSAQVQGLPPIAPSQGVGEVWHGGRLAALARRRPAAGGRPPLGDEEAHSPRTPLWPPALEQRMMKGRRLTMSRRPAARSTRRRRDVAQDGRPGGAPEPVPRCRPPGRPSSSRTSMAERGPADLLREPQGPGCVLH